MDGWWKKNNTEIKVGNMRIYVDKKFNWFQKKMIKFFFGADVNEIDGDGIEVR